jgi:HAD superfamily hydrolase (TIGR01509 family)
MQPELVIFDCDGVLIDSELLGNEVYVTALSALGIQITKEEALKEFVGVSRISAASKIEDRYGIKIPDHFWEAMCKTEFDVFEKQLKPIPGIEDLLDVLPLKKCIASSRGPVTLKNALKLVKLWDLFAPHVFSANQVKNGKPAPDIFLFAAEQMNVHPSNCLVIEDSVAGIRAAKAATMPVWGFTGGSHCGGGHAELLRAEGAHRTFPTMSDLAAAIAI